MGKIEELEDRLDRMDATRTKTLITTDTISTTTLDFVSSSIYVDVIIDISSTVLPHVDIDMNGAISSFDTNFIDIRLKTKDRNKLKVDVKSEGLLSKRIRIEGVGVRLLNI